MLAVAFSGVIAMVMRTPHMAWSGAEHAVATLLTLQPAYATQLVEAGALDVFVHSLANSASEVITAAAGSAVLHLVDLPECRPSVRERTPRLVELLRVGGAIPATVRTPAKVWRQTPATVDWSSVFVAGPAQITVNGTLHFDGYMDFATTFASATASDTFEVDDIRLRVEWKPQPKSWHSPSSTTVSSAV